MIATETVGTRRARVWSALDWRPEWPFVILVLLAWVVMFAGARSHTTGSSDPPSTETTRPALDHASHASVDPVAAAMTSRSVPTALPGLPQALADWGLMCVAMMLPVALPAVRHVALNSLRQRRPRAMVIYVAVYLATWVGVGVVTLLTLSWLPIARDGDGRNLLAAALVLAAAWQVTGHKRRALFGCKRTRPLPPLGLRADTGCAHFAGLQAWRCIKSCWALMLVMVVAGHASLLLMAAVTALVLVEEWTFLGRRLVGLSACALAVSGVLVALLSRAS